MAKDLESIAGLATLELPGVTRPGRKPKGERPLTNAERQAQFRKKRISVESGDRMTETVRALAEQFDLSKDEVIKHLLRFALCNRNWKQTGFPTTLSQKEITT